MITARGKDVNTVAKESDICLGDVVKQRLVKAQLTGKLLCVLQ